MIPFRAKPMNVLFFYGYVNSFNSVINQWNNEKVAQDMVKYDIIVLGNGVADPAHQDYANAKIVIERLKAIRPDILIFGYVSVNQTLNIFRTKVDQWDALGIGGIFLDEAGYDYGKTRADFNDRITYVKSRTSAKNCFANAWNTDHIIGTNNDPAFPNTLFNPNGLQALLDVDDWILLESFSVNTVAYQNGYASKTDWFSRGKKAVQHRINHEVRVVALNIIEDTNPNGQALFNFAYNSALIWDVDAIGSSSVNYGASTAQVKFWNRPDKLIGIANTKTGPTIVPDGLDSNHYMRYGNFSKTVIIFGAAPTSSIETW